MALPTSRNTTYTPASPVKSNDLNDLQDNIIGAKRPAMKRSIPLVLLPTAAGTWSWNAANYLISTSGVAGQGRIAVPFEVGDRITGLELRAFGDGVVDCLHKLTWFTNANVGTDLLNASDVNRAAAWGLHAPAVTAHVMADGEQLIWTIDPNAVNYRIANAFILYDRL